TYVRTTDRFRFRSALQIQEVVGISLYVFYVPSVESEAVNVQRQVQIPTAEQYLIEKEARAVSRGIQARYGRKPCVSFTNVFCDPRFFFRESDAFRRSMCE